MADLLAATRELLAVPSPSGGEAALAGLVEEALGRCPWLAVDRIGDNVIGRTGADVIGRTGAGHGRRVVLAGHLDTVPPVGNETPRLEGDTLWGVGASDMKGGLAVMLDLATTVREPAVELTWCFYAREEIGRAENGLLEVWDRRPELLAGDAAILGEPTSALVEAGCQGTMRVRVTFRGVRAHTARPFTGRNAIHRMAPLLQRVAEWPGRAVVLDGCTYAEQLQVVAVDGGVAGNVVPDEARVTVNHRYAPDRDAAQAGAFLHDLLRGTWDAEAGDSWEVLDASDGAPPSLEHPLLRSLVAESGAAPVAKVGWTDVASFWAHGVPAANFGPGDPLLAHHPDERVSAAQLERTRDVLRAVIT
jgi:succinyl-diaminopimelate desuccinylase